VESHLPRYFFDFYDGEIRRDPEGSEYADLEGIRHEAMRALPEYAKDRIPMEGDKQAYTVRVRNESNVTVYTATLTFAGFWLEEDR
jgi:hypothetical protein